MCNVMHFVKDTCTKFVSMHVNEKFKIPFTNGNLILIQVCGFQPSITAQK